MNSQPSPIVVSAADPVPALVAEFETEMREIRRRLHAHPELARAEHATTALVAQRLRHAGLEPRLLPGTGLICDIGEPQSGRGRVALRGDLDALPVSDTSGQDFASTVPGICHACGHDVHTAAVLGAGLVLADMSRRGDLHVGVRLIFQPAEEVQPSGAAEILGFGVLEGVEQIYALHCAPRLDVGKVGSRIGPITAASDNIVLKVFSRGGHTSRPHLTGDLVYALGTVITELPAVLGRRVDPRSGTNLTWGAVHAGQAVNTIPTTGTVTGTLRTLSEEIWREVGPIIAESTRALLAPLDVTYELDHQRGMPPVVNAEACVRTIDAATRSVVADDSVVLTEQSLGGEDFAWYLTQVPGAMIRLGTRTPGGRDYDLHQGDLVIDERAIGVGMRVLAQTAVLAGERPRPAIPQSVES